MQLGVREKAALGSRGRGALGAVPGFKALGEPCRRCILTQPWLAAPCQFVENKKFSTGFDQRPTPKEAKRAVSFTGMRVLGPEVPATLVLSGSPFFGLGLFHLIHTAWKQEKYQTPRSWLFWNRPVPRRIPSWKWPLSTMLQRERCLSQGRLWEGEPELTLQAFRMQDKGHAAEVGKIACLQVGPRFFSVLYCCSFLLSFSSLPSPVAARLLL